MGKRKQQQQSQQLNDNFISSPGLATLTNQYTTTAPAEEIMAAMPPLNVPTATSSTSPNPLFMLPRRQRLGSREAMKPLYDRLLEHSFPDSVSAVEFCRSACAEHGFTVKQEASANKHIYVYCSREGLPDSVRKPRFSPQRKRPSKRCDCRWRVVLSETGPNRWEFRRSLNPNAAEHNHEMMSPDEMVQNWPNEVNEFIIGLARQRMQTHEIRDMVKQQFPSIAWNERRFYNRLTEERKRIRQRDVMDRSQRLLTVSARVCSLVAANEHWSTCVESEFIRLLNHYCRLARTDGKGLVNFNKEVMKVLENNDIDDGDATGSISSSSLSDETSQACEMEDTNDDNNQEQIQPKLKRQKSLSSILSTSSPQQPAVQQKQVILQQILQSQQQVPDNVLQKETQIVHVPEYTLFVRLQSQRGSSGVSSSIQRSGRLNNASALTTEQLDVNSLSTTFPLASPEGSSSSSSTSTTLLQHHQYAFQQQRSPTSPQQSQSISDVIPSYQQQHIPYNNDGTFATTATVMQQNNSISNNDSTFTAAAYTTSLSGNPVFSSPSSELSFALENSAPSSWEHHHNQHQHSRQQTQQMTHLSNQFDPMAINSKQQAALFGYIPSDDHHHHYQQVQVQQSSMGLSNSLPLQVDNSSDTLNSPSDVNQEHWG